MPQVLSKNPRGKPIYNEDDKQSMPLSEKGLEASCQGSYKHDLLDIDTEQEKERAEQEELKRLKEEREKQLEKEQEEEEQEQQEAANEEHDDEEDRETPGEGDGEDDLPKEEEEEDSFEYEVFYNTKDIHEALTKQREDKFNDLVSTRKKILKEPEKLSTRFNILEWAPEEQADEAN